MNDTAKRFQEDPVITRAVEAAMKIIPDRGGILYWSDIETATGIDRYTGSWDTVLKKIRRRLLNERMQAVWPENGVGYRLLTHKETVHEIPARRQKRMFRQACKALKEMETADPAKLDMVERRLLISQMDRLKQERSQLRQAQKELLAATETLPQRKS